MKSFNEQNAELIEFDKTFDNSDFQSCVDRAMLLIKNREAQMTEEGYEWPIVTETCRIAIERAIIDRPYGIGMMAAAIEYVESVEARAEKYNNI
jgi:hypothetical protein